MIFFFITCNEISYIVEKRSETLGIAPWSYYIIMDIIFTLQLTKIKKKIIENNIIT